MPLDTNYYETFNRPNVTLVDLRRTPVEEITPAGIRTSAGHHDLDVIVYATGFDALTGPLEALGIRGRGGQELRDAWREGPRTYLGVAVPGFPNLFTITGPGSPSVLSNMPVSIEQHVEWIGDCLAWLRGQGAEVIEATGQAAADWSDHVQQVASVTLHPKAATWYMGANIPGKPRVFLPYIGGVGNYRDRCATVAESGYEGSRCWPSWPQRARAPRLARSGTPRSNGAPGKGRTGKGDDGTRRGDDRAARGDGGKRPGAAARAHPGRGPRPDGRDARRGAARAGHGLRPRYPGQGVGRVRAGPRPGARRSARAASSCTTTVAAGSSAGLTTSTGSAACSRSGPAAR